jgi:hypothetical protein
MQNLVFDHLLPSNHVVRQSPVYFDPVIFDFLGKDFWVDCFIQSVNQDLSQGWEVFWLDSISHMSLSEFQQYLSQKFDFWSKHVSRALSII